jgi:TonB family protein
LKLVPAIPGRAELLLPRWRSAAALDHPHLLRLMEVGECELGEQRYLYLVMEYAEQNLAQLLEHRALAADEVREMLGSTLSALEFLHGSKLVHGGLQPSNVLVVDEQIKLASDSIGPASDVVNDGGVSMATLSPYQPPEAASGARLAAGDVWALGVLTCEALSRRRPAGLHAIAGSIVLPPDIPSTFREMISKCLSRKPEGRPDIARLQAWQKGGDMEPMPPSPPEPDAVAANDAHKAPSASSIRLVIRAEIKPRDEVTEPVELKAQWRPARVIIAVAVLLGIVAAGVYFFVPGETAVGARDSTAAPRVAAAAPQPVTPRAQTPPAQTSAARMPETQTSLKQAPTKQQPVPQEAASAKQAPALPAPAVPAAPSESASATNEVLPTVPRSASETIRGTVRVSVRVIVDESGNVVAATSENPGPSRYFERLSLQAAKQWTFAPADTRGQRLMLVKFNYTRSGTTAKALPIQ